MKFKMLFLLFLISSSAFTQSEKFISKKGKILVEANSTSVLTFNNLGADDLGIGLDIGYFITKEFAFKTIYNSSIFINSDQVGSGSFHSLMIGGKYYILGRIPVQIAGGLTIQSKNEINGKIIINEIGRISIGYGIKLADNIYLEPNLSYNIISSLDYITFGLSFAMFLGKA